MKKSIYREEYKYLMDALKRAREDAGINQAQLAKAIDWMQQDISKFENCIRRLDVIEFLEICNVIGLDYKELLEDINIRLTKS